MAELGDVELFERIANQHRHHSRHDQWWKTENRALGAARSELRSELESAQGVTVGGLGFVPFSFVQMGAINTLDLFGLDELILFSFYWRNRSLYRNVIDMGANIGLHSVLLGRMGRSVTSYEPDPHHVAFLRKHVLDNGVQDRVSIVQAAVARKEGVLDFVRVLGNTTGSHVAGAKSQPYGDLELLQVPAVGVADAVKGSDLVKMDVEGLEAELLTSLGLSFFSSADVVCEVGTPKNAETIFTHFEGTSVNLYSQLSGWRRVSHVEAMPSAHSDGSLFISAADEMPWGT